MDTKCVLTRHSVGIAETFWVSTGVAGDSEHILCLEIYAGIAQVELAHYVGRQGVTQRECLEAEERAIFEVELRNLVLIVAIIGSWSRSVAVVVACGEEVLVGLGCSEQACAVVSVPALEEVGVILRVVEGITNDRAEEHAQVEAAPVCAEVNAELNLRKVAAKPSAVVVVDLAVAIGIDILDTTYAGLTEPNLIVALVFINFLLAVEHAIGLEAHP